MKIGLFFLVWKAEEDPCERVWKCVCVHSVPMSVHMCAWKYMCLCDPEDMEMLGTSQSRLYYSPVHSWWEYNLVQPLRRRTWRVLKKLKIELPQDPAVLRLGTYPEKNMVQKGTCIPMFTAVMVTLAKTWTQTKSPLTKE